MTTILHADHKAYDALVSSTVDQIITLGIQKGGEYAGDRNRLENFVRNAIALRMEPEEVWAIYYAKHHDSVIQYILDLKEGKDRPRSEPITGRVDDMIVYLLLFKCMCVARSMDNRFVLETAAQTPNRRSPVPTSVPLEEIPAFLTEEAKSLEDQLVDAVGSINEPASKKKS